MEWNPCDNVDVITAAVPFTRVCGVPMVAAPSKNVIVPVGVAPALTGVTVPVNVTAWPTVDGFADDTIPRFVGAPVESLAVPVVWIVSGLPLVPVATYTAPFILTQVLLPSLRKSQDASVIFVSSSAGRTPRAYWGAYAVAKTGLEAVSRIWSQETEAQPSLRFQRRQSP